MALEDGNYVAMDRKTENGCEIQGAACGRSGITLRLEIFMPTGQIWEKDFEDATPRGAAVSKRLVDPWISTKSIVCAYSYFASVDSAQMLGSFGTRFI